jgi:putative ABC transport system permease protein
VAAVKEEVSGWLKQQFKDPSAFVISSNDMRVEQATKGFGLFRLVMGLIVGISVLVGGIGVMNVLLISVTERTVEIGIRKAVGANKRDIVWQFLSESVTISTFGSLLGLAVGILSTAVIGPVIHVITGISFPVAYTLNTFLTVVILAIVTGIVFGTYPAIRAARLDPVEAIRRV